MGGLGLVDSKIGDCMGRIISREGSLGERVVSWVYLPFQGELRSVLWLDPQRQFLEGREQMHPRIGWWLRGLIG